MGQFSVGGNNHRPQFVDSIGATTILTRGGKGIVDSGVKYVKGYFLPLKAFRDLADLNAQVKRWVMEEAGLRRHGTTGEAPLSRFEVERAVLSPLPGVAPDLGVSGLVTAQPPRVAILVGEI